MRMRLWDSDRRGVSTKDSCGPNEAQQGISQRPDMACRSIGLLVEHNSRWKFQLRGAGRTSSFRVDDDPVKSHTTAAASLDFLR